MKHKARTPSKRRRGNRSRTIIRGSRGPQVARSDVMGPLDIVTVTAQIGDVLSRLRHRHGLAYRTRTWIDHVLPRYAPLEDPQLTRDLLAVAALDAGGLRADVSGLAAYPQPDLLAAASALWRALSALLAECESPGPRVVERREPDPASWVVVPC